MLRRFGLVWMVLIASFNVWAQQNGNDCEGTLGIATQEYEAGHFLGIDSLLAGCIRNGFSKEQKQRAYLMLTHVYLLIDEQDKAKESYLNLLRANPEFVTDPARDPIDVVYLSKKFTADPVFSVYGRLGGNLSFVNPIYSPSVTGEPTTKHYITKPGWNVAVGGEYHFRNPFSAGVELQFASTSFRREETGLWQTSDTEFEARQSWLQVPLFVKYTHTNQGKIKPYAYMGLSFNFLLSDQGSPSSFLRLVGGAQSVTPNEEPISNNSFKRFSFSKSFLVGAGLQYKWNLEYLFAEARYSLGVDNIFDYQFYDYSKTTTTDGFTDYTGVSGSGSAIEIGVQEDFFRLSNLFVTIGFRHPLYKPRELKKARTKGVLKDIKQQEE